jgi:hypothetical protein
VKIRKSFLYIHSHSVGGEKAKAVMNFQHERLKIIFYVHGSERGRAEKGRKRRKQRERETLKLRTAKEKGKRNLFFIST